MEKFAVGDSILNEGFKALIGVGKVASSLTREKKFFTKLFISLETYPTVQCPASTYRNR